MSYPYGMKMAARDEWVGSGGEWRVGDRAEAGAGGGGRIRMQHGENAGEGRMFRAG
jgi:hypothetical protein